MNFLNFIYMRVKKVVKGLVITFLPFIFFIIVFIISIWSEGYTLEDFGINLNPFDYCNLTDIEYIAILHDDPRYGSYSEVTEYLTFDVYLTSNSKLINV